MNIELIARTAYEVNRAYCEALGDHAQLPWEHAPDWQRASALYGVRFHLLHPEAGPEASHNVWLAEKMAAGWVWGLVQDADTKEHPYVCPYDQLSVEQRAQECLFTAVVRESCRHLMIWTAQRPQKTGWYWWRSPSKKAPLVVHVYAVAGALYCSFPDDEPCSVDAARGGWAGPIPEPEE